MTPLDWDRLVPAWLHESSLQGILIVDLALTIRFWNNWLAEAAGKPAAEVIGQPLIALFPDLEERGLLHVFTEALNGAERLLVHQECGYIFNLPPPHGIHEFEQMQQRVRIGPLRDNDQIIGAVALIDDMSECARQDRAAGRVLHDQQETLALLETLVNHYPVHRANGALHSIDSLEIETTDSKRTEAATRLLEQFGAVISTDDFTLAGELGHRLAQVFDSLQLYEAEQHARESAEHAVQVRDEFFSIAAHELRTPLTTMLGRIQLLERRMRRAATADDRDLRAMQTISEQAQRLNRMISALLNVSQIEMGRLQLDLHAISLRDLTRRIVEEHRIALDKHTVAFIAPADPVQIMGDELRLEQVLQNLLGNAAKYSPAGGQITVALTYTDNVARIAVIDRGIGIPASELPRLFRRFYRAEHSDARRMGGMGIGLYVVKEVVERHNGRVLVESAEGQGSTFTIELPLHATTDNP